MTDREAMQQALEALNLPSMKTMQMLRQRDDAITALRAQLEQQAEPVALIRDGVLHWHIPHEHYSRPAWTAHGTHMLYTTPPQRKPLSDDMVHRAMLALNTASAGELDPTFEEMRAALEAAHGIKETP